MSKRLAFQRNFAFGKVVNLGCGDIPVDFGPDAVHVDIDNFDYPNFVQADLHKLPFADNQFDTSILGDVLEHSPDPVQMMKEAGRVARVVCATIFEEPYDEDGEDCIKKRGFDSVKEWYDSMPNKPYKHCTEIVDDEKMPHHFHIQHFTDDDIWRIMKMAGLEIIIYHKVIEGIHRGKPHYNWLVLAKKKGDTQCPIA